jgi:N-acyl-L-homoserine lactone synthetase
MSIGEHDMIKLVSSKNRSKFSAEMDAIFSIRKKVFFERMRWNVVPINKWEIDGYDAIDPLYVLSINEHAQVVGGLRLLPTMGFNMLNDTFPELLPDGVRIESPLIWESSRFAVDHEADVPIGPKGISRATAELGLAMNEIGAQIGLTHVVTVYDALMHRILKRAGCAGEPLGPAQRIGTALTYAVFFEIGAETERALRDASGIEGSVLEPDTLRLALAA